MAKKMAKKRPPPPPAPPSSSSDEEGSSSDDQEPITKSPNPKTPTNNHQEADSDTESGSSDEEAVTKSPDPKTPTNKTDDGSESDSVDDKEDEDDEEAEKPRSDAMKPESVPTTAAATPALKPLDAGEKSNKKGKANGNGKFQRIWSLDDEITILKAIIEFESKFESKHGRFKREGAGIRDFHHFVKDSLSLEVNDNQLYEKIRRLKKKYHTAAARARKNGKAVKSGKPHDEKVYELSKEIWGAGNENEVKVNSKRAATVANDGGGGSLKRKYLYLKDALLNAGHDISAEVLAALDPERAMFFENEFKKQRVEDYKSTIRELDLVKQALTFIVEHIESTVD